MWALAATWDKACDKACDRLGTGWALAATWDKACDMAVVPRQVKFLWDPKKKTCSGQLGDGNPGNVETAVLALKEKRQTCVSLLCGKAWGRMSHGPGRPDKTKHGMCLVMGAL